MICCKECIELLHDYLEGELSPEINASLEEHFLDCPPCIAFVNTYKSATQICKTTLQSKDIPDAVKSRLKEFVDRKKNN
ncbi:MAG: zf-HC2 domain-containing protein [Nitrospina sp.]|jgi:anti-sigma factor RsiW|nr:zf-HC2 domain-containing protein [Nitrospina sp.]MBT6601896.1 zf-HC2 domain-containing protein [Nitrospina sp.]